MAANHADIHIPPECREMIRAGALVAVNTSGGKDSQSMTILLSRIVPRDQIVAVHAPLVDVEWPGTVDFIRATLPPDIPLILAPVTSGKTLLDSIEERGRFPSPKVRWCTSSLKRGPIERELRRFLKVNPRFGGRLVNTMGMRAEESPARARKAPWRRNDRMSAAGREVFDWLPVFELSTDDVFRIIRDAGQSPHPAYRITPVPDAEHFIAQLASDDTERVKRDIERHVEEQLHGAVGDLYRRFGEAVERVSERLREDDDGKPLVFRDTMISNIRDLVDVVPRLNIFGDDELARLCEQVKEKIASVEPDALRPSKTFDPAARAQVKRNADELAEKFAGYFGGRAEEPAEEPVREAA